MLLRPIVGERFVAGIEVLVQVTEIPEIGPDSRPD